MKIRTGFVSNSSSTAFVVALDSIPRRKKDILEVFFPDADGYIYGGGDYGFTEYVPVEYAARQIRDQIYKHGTFKGEDLLENDLLYDSKNLKKFLSKFKTHDLNKKKFVVLEFGTDAATSERFSYDFNGMMESGPFLDHLPHFKQR